MGALENIGSSALELGGSLISNELIGKPNAEKANSAAAYASQTAWNRTKTAYKKRYQKTTKDMKRAGLNPILAVSSGFNVGSGNISIPAQTYQAPNPQTSLTSSAKDYTQADKNISETDKTKKDTEKVVQETKQIIKQIAKTKGEIGKIAQETLNLMQLQEKLKNEVKITAAQAKQQQVKAKAYKLLDHINDGYQEIIDLFSNDAILVEDLKNDSIKVIVPRLKKTQEYFKNGINAIKNFLNKGVKLPKSPRLLK